MEESETTKIRANLKRDSNRVIAAMENRGKEINTLFRQLLSAPSAPPATPETNSIITFFRSMAQTLTTFPPYLAVKAKGKIYQVVTDLEYRAISPRGDSYETKFSLVSVLSDETTLNSPDNVNFLLNI